MPRIRRWHPVSHDLVRDREFLALLDLHPRLGYMWLEMLSEADRNEGRVKGSREEIEQGFGRVINPAHPHKGKHWSRVGLEYMESRGWVEEVLRGSREGVEVEQSHFYVRNYPEYHPRREQASSPPSLLPSLLPKDRLPKGSLVPRPELTPTELMESWNEICASEGLPRIEKQTNGRKARARARLKTFPTSEFWGKVLNGIIESDYLMGRKRKEGDTWKPDFDWLVKNDETPAKIMEGKYD